MQYVNCKLHTLVLTCQEEEMNITLAKPCTYTIIIVTMHSVVAIPLNKLVNNIDHIFASSLTIAHVDDQ